MKGGKKKADWLETLGPKEWHHGEFPRFSFCLTYSRLGAEEVATGKCQWVQKTKKKAPTSLLSLSRGPAKGQPSKTG